MITKNCPWMLTDKIKENLFANEASDFAQYGIFFDELLRKTKGWKFGSNGKAHHAFYLVIKGIFDFYTQVKKMFYTIPRNTDLLIQFAYQEPEIIVGYYLNEAGFFKEVGADILDADKNAQTIITEFVNAFGGVDGTYQFISEIRAEPAVGLISSEISGVGLIVLLKPNLFD